MIRTTFNDARNNKVPQKYATSYLDMDSGFNVEGQASALKIDPLRWNCLNGVQSESAHPHESFQQFIAEKINNSFSPGINKSTLGYRLKDLKSESVYSKV